MKKIVRSAIVKLVIVVIVWALVGALNQIFMPVWTNEMALNQLDLTSQSYTGWAAWNTMWAWVWSILSLVSVAIFIPNVVAAVKYKKNEESK